MLRPSYSELMEILNNENEDLDNKITSRYTIVIAAAKRARQIVNGADCDTTGVTTDKAVSIAVEEIRRGKINVLPDGSPEDEYMAYEPVSYDYASMTESSAPIDFNADDDFDDEFDDEYGDDLDIGLDEAVVIEEEVALGEDDDEE